MSTIIIGGGGQGHTAITRLVALYPRATADQKARILALLQTFTEEAKALAEEVDNNA